MRVGVMCGGRSLEREISLRSGQQVAAALRHLGHEVDVLDIDEHLTGRLRDLDIAFIALHGRDGEDGAVQSLLEAAGVPYTGSTPLTCAITFDKPVAKALLRREGLPTPAFHVVSAEAIRLMGAGAAVRAAADRLGYPLVVKPAAQGSGLGVTLVETDAALSAAVVDALNHGDRVMLESFISGPEIAISFLAQDGALEALPTVEVRSPVLFDFHVRMAPGATEFIVPTALETGDAVSIAGAAAGQLGVRDFGRVDLRIGPDGPSIIDLNTCPGLTEQSLLPLAASSTGIDFPRVVDAIVRSTLRRHSTTLSG